MNWQKIKIEATNLLQELIRFDTSNPPGNEEEAIEHIRCIAQECDFHVQKVVTAPGRSNLIISYNGTYRNPLILLSHIDVVPAKGDDWTQDPFGGEIVDDVLYGRGTLDTKQLTVMQMMAMKLLHRKGTVLDEDIVMVITADEEAGSQYGLLKVLEQHSDLFQGATVISEGGGFPIIVNDIPHYLCEVGQKGVCRLTFKFPENKNANRFIPNNEQIGQSAELAAELNNISLDEEIPATTQKLIRELTKSAQNPSIDRPISEQLDGLRETISPFLYTLLDAMTKSTFAVTKWKANTDSHKKETLIEVDGRILPGMTKETVVKKIEETIKGTEVEWEMTSFSAGYESPYKSPLFTQMDMSLKKEFANSKLVPFISIGSSDGRFLRKYQSAVYGFSPVLPDLSFEKVLPLVHGVDERIPLESLLFGTRVLYDVVKNYSFGRNKK